MTDGPIDPPTPATGMRRLRTEAEIRALTVDIVRPLTGLISLVEDDPGWPPVRATFVERMAVRAGIDGPHP